MVRLLPKKQKEGPVCPRHLIMAYIGGGSCLLHKRQKEGLSFALALALGTRDSNMM